MNRKNKKPSVSVIIPVFNGSLYLEKTVESVLKSKFRDFEVLLVDDGSKDSSRQICHDLEKKYSNVKFYSFKKNKGLGRVLNFALRKARGKYICRINQDDLMIPSRIKIQVDFLKNNPLVVAVGSYVRLFRNNSKQTEIIKFLTKDEDIRKVWYLVSAFADPSVMYSKDIAIKAGGYWQSMWPADDTHLWYRMGQLGKLANINRPLVKVRWHEGAASIKYFRRMAISTYKMHLWIDKNVGRASMWIRMYWLVQFAALYLLPPQFNWGVYRLIKKGIDRYHFLTGFLTRSFAKINIANKVAIQPIKLSLSGK